MREFACVRGFVSVCIHVCVPTFVRMCGMFSYVCLRTCECLFVCVSGRVSVRT